MPTHIVWIAYSISNILALLLLWACWKRPSWGRLLFFLLFGWAAWFNAVTALSSPGIYTGYAQYTFSAAYRAFISGYFAAHPAPFVLAIAVGQAGISIGMLAKGWLFRLGAAGGMVFLAAITPLGVGSAFPCTLIMGAGLWMLYREGSDCWLWQVFYK